MDNEDTIIIGPQSLIEQLASDPRLSGTLQDEMTDDFGGLPAERKQSPLKGIALAGALLATTNHGLTVADHFLEWMNKSGSDHCEVIVRPKPFEQHLLRFHKGMERDEISAILDEFGRP